MIDQPPGETTFTKTSTDMVNREARIEDLERSNMTIELKSCSAGITGILTGVVQAGEFILFILSGCDPLVLNDPETGLALLHESGVHIKAASRALLLSRFELPERDSKTTGSYLTAMETHAEELLLRQ